MKIDMEKGTCKISNNRLISYIRKLRIVAMEEVSVFLRDDDDVYIVDGEYTFKNGVITFQPYFIKRELEEEKNNDIFII